MPEKYRFVLFGDKHEVKLVWNGKTNEVCNVVLLANAESALSANVKAGSKIMLEQGRIVRVTNDKHVVMARACLTRHWTDWIDYWSVAFDFESKREIIRIKMRAKNPEPTASRTAEQMGNVAVVGHEQVVLGEPWSRIRKQLSKNPLAGTQKRGPRMLPGMYKIAVKVVNNFGDDTMTIVEVTV